MLPYKKVPLMFCLLVLGSIFSSESMAQSLNGTTGLVTIPTARMQKDGTLSIGVSYFDQNSQVYFDGTKNIGVAYINMTFLPFLELVYRVNKALYYHTGYIMDRLPMIRLRLLNEKTYIPAIAIGVHDFGSTSDKSTIHFNATYIVLSKKVTDFDFHLGYAPPLMKAVYHQFDGLFGGLAYKPANAVEVYAEYDSRNVNAGLQFQFLKHFAINLASLNFNSYAAGINFRVKL